jgi:hypothetical protein
MSASQPTRLAAGVVMKVGNGSRAGPHRDVPIQVLILSSRAIPCAAEAFPRLQARPDTLPALSR